MLTLLIMKEKEKQKKKIKINKIIKYLCYFKKLVIEIILGYFRKKFKEKELSIYFLSGKLCGTTCKFEVIFITRMPVFLLLPLENEFLEAFSSINAHNNEEFRIKHWEKISCEVCGRFFWCVLHQYDLALW